MTNTLHCLIIDDDSTAAAATHAGLLAAGYRPTVARSGEAGLAMALSARWDLIVIEAALAGTVNGIDVVTSIRAVGHLTPIVMVSASASCDEVVRGLRGGADDYVAKPFAMTELMARIDALWRRTAIGAYALQLRVEDLMLDVGSMRVSRGTQQIALQLREFKLLEFLMRHEGQVVSRDMLLKDVWDYHFDPKTNVIEVQINRLRSKMDKPFGLPLIHTVRGSGYVLSAEQPGRRADSRQFRARAS